QLDVARMEQRHLEPMYVEVGAALAGQDAGGTIVIGMDVGHEQATQASRAELGQRPLDGLQRIFGVHTAVEEVDLLAGLEHEDVDESVLERNRETKFENVRRHLAQRELDCHLRILAALRWVVGRTRTY